MAVNVKLDKFSIAVIVLIVITATLFLYSEKPFIFSFFEKPQQSGAGVVSLYVLPHDEGTGETQENSGAGT